MLRVTLTPSSVVLDVRLGLIKLPAVPINPPLQNQAPVSEPVSQGVNLKWIAGVAGVWLGLTIMYDLGLEEVAATFAALIAVSATLWLGPDAFNNITKAVS